MSAAGFIKANPSVASGPRGERICESGAMNDIIKMMDTVITAL